MLIWRSTSPAALGRLLTLMAQERRRPRPRRALDTRSCGDTVLGFNDRPLIATCADLYSLAAALEREAAGQYSRLAQALRCQGNDSLAVLFHRLSACEAEHLSLVCAWASAEGLDAGRPPSFRWDPIEGPPAQVSILTPRLALAHAIRNEERASAFYRDIARATPCPQVRAHAERMAAEELEHVLLLRRRERETPARPLDGPRWRSLVVRLEADCGRRHRAAAELLRRWRRPALAALFQDLAEDAEVALRKAGHATIFSGTGAITAAGPEHLMRQEETHLSATFARLHDAAPGEDGEPALRRAAARLARLRDGAARHGAAA